MGHTPGPWCRHFCSAVAEQADGEYEAATGITNISEAEFAATGRRGDLMAWVPHDRDHEANAHLIAAAPELLSQLKMAADFISGHNECLSVPSGSGDRQWNDYCVGLLEDCKAAIDKAEGRGE